MSARIRTNTKIAPGLTMREFLKLRLALEPLDVADRMAVLANQLILMREMDGYV